MSVIDINEARRRREQIREAAIWAFTELPWTAGALSERFAQAWPDMTIAERIEAGRQMERMTEVQVADLTELAVVRATLRGRIEHWSPAMHWLLSNPPDLTSPDFRHKFAHLSRSEIMIAVLERGRRRKVIEDQETQP